MTATPTAAEAWDEAIAWARHNRDAVGRDVLDRTFNPYRQPDLTPQPGDVAIATVRGVEGVLVVRVSDLWMSNVSVPTGLGMFWHQDRDVTDQRRAVVVTEADRDELLRARIADCDKHGASGVLEEGCDWCAARGIDQEWFDAIREWFAAKLGGERS